MTKTLCIIPARGGSKGLARKNIKYLSDKPLIAYPIETAKSSGVVDHVFVSTDDAEIAEVARDYGADVPFLRTPHLAEDATTMEETLQEALLSYEKHRGETFDICVFLTATDIFRKIEWVTEAVTRLRNDPTLESVFTGQATFKNYWEKLPVRGFQRVRPYMQEYGQRQERIRNGRLIYREDTGLTCASRSWLWRKGRRIGDVVDIIETDDIATDIDIHTEFDFYLVEKILEWRSKSNE